MLLTRPTKVLNGLSKSLVRYIQCLLSMFNRVRISGVCFGIDPFLSSLSIRPVQSTSSR